MDLGGLDFGLRGGLDFGDFVGFVGKRATLRAEGPRRARAEGDLRGRASRGIR